MKNYQIRFAIATVQAASLAEAVAKADAVVVEAREASPSGNLIDQLGTLIRDVQQVKFPEAVEEVVVDTNSGAAEEPAPDTAFANPADAFEVGAEYKSDTGKWVGIIQSRTGNSFSIGLENTQTGNTETRTFTVTPGGNLRSTTGNVVFRADNKVD